MTWLSFSFLILMCVSMICMHCPTKYSQQFTFLTFVLIIAFWSSMWIEAAKKNEKLSTTERYNILTTSKSSNL